MKLYSDGYCLESNPNKIGGGYTIVDENEVLIETKCFLRHMTNNEAELLGCLRALELAENEDTIIVDSMNTIRWILNIRKLLEKPKSKKSKRRARKDLDNIKLEAHDLAKKKNIKIIWESRDKNLAGAYNELVYGS